MKCLSFLNNDLIFPLWVEKARHCQRADHSEGSGGPEGLSSVSQPIYKVKMSIVPSVACTIASRHGKVFMQSPSASGHGALGVQTWVRQGKEVSSCFVFIYLT